MLCLDLALGLNYASSMATDLGGRFVWSTNKTQATESCPATEAGCLKNRLIFAPVL